MLVAHYTKEVSKIKLSTYNLWVEQEGSIIILNTLSGGFVKLFDEYGLIGCVLRNEAEWSSLSSSILSLLVAKNIIIQEDEDEEQVLNDLFKRTVNNPEMLNLILMPTEKCNFNCIYCYEHHSKSFFSIEMKKNLIRFIETRLNGVKSLNIDWFGGEPTIAVDIIESITEEVKKLCKQYKVRFVASMTTNGYLLDIHLLKRLKKMNIYSYQITIDGFKETHDKQRMLISGAKTWERIFQNLLAIKNNYKSGLLEISIRINLSRTIYCTYEKFIDFLSDQFGDDKRFSFLIKLVADYGNIENSIRKIFCTHEEYMEVLLYSLKKGLRNASIINSISPGGMLCYAFKSNSYLIQPNGVVSKCTLNLYSSFNKLGDLQSGVFDIENTFNTAIIKKNKKCQECIKYPICLKADCNMMTKGEMECDPDMANLHQILPFICNSSYNCETNSGKFVEESFLHERIVL